METKPLVVALLAVMLISGIAVVTNLLAVRNTQSDIRGSLTAVFDSRASSLYARGARGPRIVPHSGYSVPAPADVYARRYGAPATVGRGGDGSPASSEEGSGDSSDSQMLVSTPVPVVPDEGSSRVQASIPPRASSSSSSGSSSGGGGGGSMGVDAEGQMGDDLLNAITERIRGRYLNAAQVQPAAQLLTDYATLCRKILDPADNSVPKRYVYYGAGLWKSGSSDFSFGNKFMGILTAVALGIATDRALIVKLHGHRHGKDYFIHDLFEDPFFKWSLVEHMSNPQHEFHNNRHPAGAPTDKCRRQGTCSKIDIGKRYKGTAGTGGKPSKYIDVDWQEKDLNKLYAKQRIIQVNTWAFYGPWLWSNPHHRPKLAALESDFSGILARFLFKPSPRLQSYIDTAKKQLFGDYTLTLHMRDQRSIGGKKMPHPPKKGLACARQVFTQGLERHRKQYPEARGRVFVAAQHSSAISMAADTFASFGRDIVSHLQFSKLGNVRLPDRSKKEFHAFEALTDMFLLAHGDDLVQTQTSTFSAFAYAWGGIKPWTGACGEHPNSQLMELCYQYNHEKCQVWADAFRWKIPADFPVSIYACPKWPQWQVEGLC